MTLQNNINNPQTIRWVAEHPYMEIKDEHGNMTRRPKVLAVVGLSDNTVRPSYGTSEAMQLRGYKVVPVNPQIQSVLGETSYASLHDVPAPVDVVQVFRRAEHTPDIARAAAAEAQRLGIQVLWLQEGIVNEEAAAIAQEAGLQVVMSRCLFQEAVRLGWDPSTV